MKKIILIIVLLTISLQAEMRLAVLKKGIFSTNGIENFKIFGKNKVQSYEDFITKTTKCKKYKVLAMSQSKNSCSKILIDCLD